MPEDTLTQARPAEKDKKSEPAATATPPAAGGTQPQAATQPVTARQAVELDDSKAVACYANFCRVTGTPEEVILDLGLNPHPFGTPNEPVKVTQRLVMNFFTAKRLWAALQMTIQRHEGTFGVLETDVTKRVKSAAR